MLLFYITRTPPQIDILRHFRDYRWSRHNLTLNSFFGRDT